MRNYYEIYDLKTGKHLLGGFTSAAAAKLVARNMYSDHVCGVRRMEIFIRRPGV